jgi:Zn-dependent peptidase ImmA (M78 family)
MPDFDTLLQKYADKIPFPVVEFAKELGIKVFVKKYPDKKSGEIKKDNGNYCIFINDSHSYERNRFTLAHELAHYRLHKDVLDRDKEIEDFVGETNAISLARDKSQARDKREVDADQLAADILMPEDAFLKVWADKKTVKEVAAVFAVSTTAAAVRAQTFRSKNVQEKVEAQCRSTALHFCWAKSSV